MFVEFTAAAVQFQPLQGQATSSVLTASKHVAGGKLLIGVKQGRSSMSLMEESMTVREASEAENTAADPPCCCQTPSCTISIHALPASQAASSKWLYSILL